MGLERCRADSVEQLEHVAVDPAVRFLPCLDAEIVKTSLFFEHAAQIRFPVHYSHRTGALQGSGEIGTDPQTAPLPGGFGVALIRKNMNSECRDRHRKHKIIARPTNGVQRPVQAGSQKKQCSKGGFSAENFAETSKSESVSLLFNLDNVSEARLKSNK